MKLFEFQSKDLLRTHGLVVPSSKVIEPGCSVIKFSYPAIIKAQILEGKRGKQGLIKKVNNEEEVLQFVHQHANVTLFLLEELVDHDKEFFLSMSYDFITRNLILFFSEHGGMSIEESGIVHKLSINVFDADLSLIEDFFKKINPEKWQVLAETAKKLVKLFVDNDLLLCEINPFIIKENGIIILDAKIEIDDNSAFRHTELFEKFNTQKYALTGREQAARQIDEQDTRGVAGKSYLDLDGDIAILASGGGASLAALDILMDSGGQPANYVEYSGNPPKEKVKQLTKITLSKDNLAGCWIVGGIANFTDIYETLQGIMEAILELDELPAYPIVIRRAGPNDDKAKIFIEEIRKKYPLNIHFFDEKTSICQSADEIIQLSNDFKNK